MSDLDDFGYDGTSTDDLPGPLPETPPADTPAPYDIPDDAFVSVKVNGEDKLLPWKEARAGVMFQSAFTQKTQDLARQRQEFENHQREFAASRQQYDQRIGTLTEVLKDPQQLMALYMHAASLKQGQAPPPPAPLTTDYLPKFEQTMEQMLSKRLDKVEATWAQKQNAERYGQDLETFMSSTLTRYPLLQAIPGIEDTIFGRVAQLGVKTLPEAKEQARQMAESMNLQIQKAYEDQQKRAALDKANATRNGIEPRGGQAPMRDRSNIKKLEDMDGDWLAFLQNQDRADSA